jgi:predicted dehydrogenase
MNTTGKIRLGLIGLGAISAHHLEAIDACDAFVLAGVCDASADRLAAVAGPRGVRGFEDYRELLASELDAVAISLPHHLHAPVALEAMRAGRHVLVEKPAAITMDSLREMLRAADDGGRRAFVADSAYADPKNLAAAEIVRCGRLGRFLFADVQNYRSYFKPDRPQWFLQTRTSGGGQFSNIGVHRVAAVRRILGGLRERAVLASVHRIHPEYDIEAAAKVLLSCEAGEAIGFEEAGYYPPPEALADCRMHFVFEAGVLGVEADGLWMSDRDGRVERVEVPAPPAGGVYGPIYRQWAEAIGGGSDAGGDGPSLVNGARDVRVALAAYESARTQEAVRLDGPAWELA